MYIRKQEKKRRWYNDDWQKVGRNHVARCRDFNHRTRAFSYVKHGQARRHAPDRPSPIRRSSTGHPSGCSYLHVPPVIAASPSPAGRHGQSGLVPRHPLGHQAMLAAVVGSSRNLPADLSGPDTGIQIWSPGCLL